MTCLTTCCMHARGLLREVVPRSSEVVPSHWLLAGEKPNDFVDLHAIAWVN